MIILFKAKSNRISSTAMVLLIEHGIIMLKIVLNPQTNNEAQSNIGCLMFKLTDKP